MRALTLHQPWAWAVAAGHKVVENRTWAPSPKAVRLGDLFAVHAGKTYDDAGEQWIRERFPSLVIPGPDTATKGAVIGS